MIDYYARIADAILPHIRARPMTLKRYPNGVAEKHFYEKRCPKHRPDWVETAPIWSGRNEGEIDYCVCDDRATLIWMAQLASLELHPSLSRSKEIERPTVLAFDLDPGAPATIMECCTDRAAATRAVRRPRSRELPQDLRVQGHPGLCPAEHEDRLRADEAVRTRRRAAARAPGPGPRRLADGEEPAQGQGARGLEPERRAQDDGLRLLPAGQRAPHGLDARRVEGGRASAQARGPRVSSASRRATC